MWHPCCSPLPSAMPKIRKNFDHSPDLSEQELQQFYLAATRFFDQLSQNLSRHLPITLTIADVTQGFDSFEVFCKAATAQLLLIPVLKRGATLVFCADRQMSRLMIDALLMASDKMMPTGDEKAEVGLSVTESRILVQILGGAFTKVVDEVFGRFFGGHVVDLIQNVDHAGLLAHALDPGERLLIAKASATVGGRDGELALALPLSLVAPSKTTEAIHNSNPVEATGPEGVGRLAAVPIEMSAVLAERQLPLAEVRYLKEGAVILLQRLRHLPKAQLRAAGQVLFRGAIVENQGWHNFLIQQVETADVERPAD
jgi:flagellar motor switch protein FliM